MAKKPATTLTRMPRAEQWADRISTQVGKSVEALIEVGRLLVQAKADLPHGEWGRLFSEELIPFSQNTAGQLMAISSNRILSNSAHVQNLPPSWGTLYELTKVPDITLANALKDGVITPDMPRSAVAGLLPAKAAREPKPDPPFNLDRAMTNLVTLIRDIETNWPADRSMARFISTLETECNLLRRR